MFIYWKSASQGTLPMHWTATSNPSTLDLNSLLWLRQVRQPIVTRQLSIQVQIKCHNGWSNQQQYQTVSDSLYIQMITKSNYCWNISLFIPVHFMIHNLISPTPIFLQNSWVFTPLENILGTYVCKLVLANLLFGKIVAKLLIYMHVATIDSNFQCSGLSTYATVWYSKMCTNPK